jgi:hypothetical protein
MPLRKRWDSSEANEKISRSAAIGWIDGLGFYVLQYEFTFPSAHLRPFSVITQTPLAARGPAPAR